MKRFSLIALVAAAMVMWGLTSADARPRKRGGGRSAGAANPEQLAKALELTPEQQKKLKALRLDNAKKMVRLRADLQIAQMDMKSLLDQPAPNSAEVKARVAEVNRVNAEILSKRIDHQLGMKGILTPEQQQKLQTLQKRAKMRMQKGRRSGRGRPGACCKPGPCRKPGAAKKPASPAPQPGK